MGVCSLGVKEVNEDGRCQSKASGHQYTLWMLVSLCLCPRPSPLNSHPPGKKNRRQSANSFSGHPWSPTFSQAAPEKDNSQPSSDSWIGWLSCRIAVAKTTWIVSAGGLRMEPNFLLYPELSRNLHLPGCYVCVTTSLRKYITTSCSFFHESEHGIKEIR